jgi:adenylate cyclase class 2
MENIEYECTILDIDSQDFISKLISLGAKNKGEYFQRRYVYDFNPVNRNKWIRLRTNGDTTTICIKEIKNRNAIGGTSEIEVEVGDFDTANEILESLGYHHRNYQENVRRSFTLNGVSIDIDSWPLIPDYVEVEGSSESEVLDTLKLLGISQKEITTLDVESIYKDIYGIDLLKIKELKFDEALLESN